MKKISFAAIGLAFVLTSCFKSETCTCKDSSGKVMSTETKKTNSRKDMKAFEDECKSSSTTINTSGTSGSSSTSIPCEIS